jgi:hypothetical protein
VQAAKQFIDRIASKCGDETENSDQGDAAHERYRRECKNRQKIRLPGRCLIGCEISCYIIKLQEFVSNEDLSKQLSSNA